METVHWTNSLLSKNRFILENQLILRPHSPFLQPCEVKGGLVSALWGVLALCEEVGNLWVSWIFLENSCYPQGLPHQKGGVNNNQVLIQCASILCVFRVWVALVGAARSIMVDENMMVLQTHGGWFGGGSEQKRKERKRDASKTK